MDEEHRFGVKHKERLKALRLAVDVLTLTATPIPRTLHLSLAGLRDLTLIETPPRDRSPILTFVEPWDDALLEEAMARELDRGGQVFLVHNRIETIETIAARVRALAPRARVGGRRTARWPADELEAVMQRFVAGELDILVSTMIVESGLDVPNANTMIVHDAHRFGLAQLYQLRGPGGPEPPAGLLLPRRARRRSIADAEERLKVLEHHTDLGAGYRIALKDLELRGAGNLLGRGAVGPRPRGRVRPVPALAGGDGAGAPRARAAARSRRRRRWCSTGRPTCPDSYVADDDVQARPLPPTGAGGVVWRH